MALPIMTPGAQTGVEAAGGTLFRHLPPESHPSQSYPTPRPVPSGCTDLPLVQLTPPSLRNSLPSETLGDKEVMS